MYNYEGNLGEKNGRINPLFAYMDKPSCLSVLEQVVIARRYMLSIITIAKQNINFNGFNLYSFIVKFLAGVIHFTSKVSLF